MHLKQSSNVVYLSRFKLNLVFALIVTQVILFGYLLALDISEILLFTLLFGIPIALVVIAGWLSAWWKSTAEDKFTVTVITVYGLILPFCIVNDF